MGRCATSDSLSGFPLQHLRQFPPLPLSLAGSAIEPIGADGIRDRATAVVAAQFGQHVFQLPAHLPVIAGRTIARMAAIALEALHGIERLSTVRASPVRPGLPALLGNHLKIELPLMPSGTWNAAIFLEATPRLKLGPARACDGE